MTAQKQMYATKAKVEHAIRMAQLAGIHKIGSIELSADGAIRIGVAPPASSPAASVEDEIARWRERKGR